MSSPISTKFTPYRIGNAGRLVFSPFMTENLADFVRRIMLEKGLSTYDVEKKASQQITQSHINRIKNGEVKNPSPEKLRWLAKGLGVAEWEVFQKVRARSVTDLTHERLASIEFAYRELPKSKKAKADYIIELLETAIEKIKEEEQNNG